MDEQEIKMSDERYNRRDFVIKKTRNGNGLFVARDFGALEILFPVIGTFIDCDEEDDIDEKIRDNTYRFNQSKYISPAGTIGDYVNHSCEPNAQVVKKKNKLFIVAYKPIKKSEEIFIDYSTIIADDDVWEMKCNCGTKKCRGIIKKFKSLPEHLQREYVVSKLVPKYIQNINMSKK
jgi:hypothetical protein